MQVVAFIAKRKSYLEWEFYATLRRERRVVSCHRKVKKRGTGSL